MSVYSTAITSNELIGKNVILLLPLSEILKRFLCCAMPHDNNGSMLITLSTLRFVFYANIYIQVYSAL